MERDLLRGDETDEHLPGIRDEWRPVRPQGLRERGQRRLGPRPGPEAAEVERYAEQPGSLAQDVVLGRIDLDATGRSLQSYLAPGDDAVQPSVVPGIGAVDAVGAEPLRGREEVVWLRQREEGDAPIVRTRALRLERLAHVVQILEGLEGHTLSGEVLRQTGAGEHALRGKRRAAIGDAVADVHIRRRAGEGDPLARLTAHLARLALEERRAPTRRVGLDVVRHDRGRDALTGEHRLD